MRGMKQNERGRLPNSPQLCWTCVNSVPDEMRGIGCPWSKCGKPVKGWKATPTTIKLDPGRVMESYDIRECPLYAKEAMP